MAVGGLPVSTLTLLYTADSYFKHLKFSAFSALAAGAHSPHMQDPGVKTLRNSPQPMTEGTWP